MGVEGIIAIIERDADEEATRLVEDAEREAREIIAGTEADVQAQVAAALERLGPEIHAAAQRRINEVRLRILEERASADAARLVAVFDRAEERIAAIAGGADPARWSTALSSLCVEAVHAIGKGATVRIRARDADAVRGVAERWRAEVVARGDDEEPGLVARSSDGRIEVDARLSVRLERARSLLAESVAQLLRLESADREPEART